MSSGIRILIPVHYEASSGEILGTPRAVDPFAEGHKDSKQRPGSQSLRFVPGRAQGDLSLTLKHSLKIQAGLAKEGMRRCLKKRVPIQMLSASRALILSVSTVGAASRSHGPGAMLASPTPCSSGP